MAWTFAQMAAARRIIQDNSLHILPVGMISPGYRLRLEETEAILQTLLVAGVTYQDLVDQETQWSQDRARYGRVR